MKEGIEEPQTTEAWAGGGKVTGTSSLLRARSGGEKGLRGRGAGTLGVPLGGPRRVGGLLGVAGRLSGTVSPFRAEQGTSLVSPNFTGGLTPFRPLSWVPWSPLSGLTEVPWEL